jgi:hypothetical protein
MSEALHPPPKKLAPTDGAYWEYDGYGALTGRMMVLFESEEFPLSRNGCDWTLWKCENDRGWKTSRNPS